MKHSQKRKYHSVKSDFPKVLSIRKCSSRMNTPEKREGNHKTSYVYGIVREIYSFDGIQRISYGIVCYANPAIDGTASVFASVHDITADYASLCRIAELCNKLSLSPDHLQDVVEDFLS